MSIFSDLQERRSAESESLANELQKQLSDGGYSADDFDEPRGFRGPGIVYGNDVPSTVNANEYIKAAVGWVYACVSAIAEAVAHIDFELYEIAANGDITEIDDDPILDLLSRVNPFQTKNDHFYLSQTYLELMGEAPWFIDRGKSGTGEPTSMLLLRPDKLKIKKATAGSDSPIDSYELDLDGGKKMTFTTDEIVFLKYPDPANMFRGKGTLRAAALTVDVDTYSEEYNKRFFYNSARPDSILQTSQKLTPSQREELRNSLRKLYQGRENAHKTAILESGLEWKPMSMSAKDMDFLEQQKFSMSKILSIFRVPKPIAAITDDVNLANAKIAEYIFAKWTITPKLARLCAQLNEFLLPMFQGSENKFLSFENPVPQDTELDLKRYASGLGAGGAAPYMTMNEVRNEVGLDPIGPEGDTLYLPMTVQPIGMAGEQQPPVKSISVNAKKVKNSKLNNKGIIQRSGGGYHIAMRRMHKKLKASKVKNSKLAAVKSLATRLDELALAAARQIVRKQHQDARIMKENDQEEKLHAQWSAFGSAMVLSAAGYERKFKKITIDQFNRQEKKVLAAMPKKDVTIDDWLLNPDDESQLAVVAYTPDMKKLVKEQGDRAAKLVASDALFDQTTRAVQEYLKTRVLKFSFDMTEETNNLLKTALQEGVKNGESIALLKNRVKDVFSNMESYRAERIARSEVIRASNFAATEAYQQSGVVDKVQWLTTEDDRTCPYCDPLNGKEIAIGETFFQNGDAVNGTDGTEYHIDYADVEYPPLHPSCRCTTVPIVSKAIHQPVKKSKILKKVE